MSKYLKVKKVIWSWSWNKIRSYFNNFFFYNSKVLVLKGECSVQKVYRTGHVKQKCIFKRIIKLSQNYLLQNNLII